MAARKGGGGRRVSRSAKTGKFVKHSTARKRPGTTVTHTYKKKRRGR